MRPYFCEDASPVFFNLFDFSIAPPLLYYAYIPIVIVTVILALTALIVNRNGINSRYFAFLSFSLGIYVFCTLLTWIAAPISLVMLGWQLWALTTALLFMSTTLFVISFVFDRGVPTPIKTTLIFLLFPIIFFTPTTLNIEAFDLINCEGWLTSSMNLYTYFYCIICVLLVLAVGAYAYIKPSSSMLRGNLLLLTIGGATLFLASFLFTFILGDIFFYELEIIGPVGAAAFIAVISYVSINHNRFDMRLRGAEILIASLVVAIASMMFVNSIDYVRYISAATIVFTAIIGFLLLRSIRKERKQRAEIERLAQKLERANKRLRILDQMKSEFVSIASHQLRSPLTSIRGYASMLLEGSYGKLPQKAADAIARISESSKFMATSVEDYLSVSRIQAGNMKYELSDFNLREEAERIADDVRSEATHKGLLLLFRSDLKGKGIVHADKGKTRQILHNLINNAIKYTPNGKITVYVHDTQTRKKEIHVDIIDTGIGMAPETIDEMFDKFERAHNANEVNVTGTGLGLYVARKMAVEMGGNVTAASEGEGEGSSFTLSLPMVM